MMAQFILYNQIRISLNKKVTSGNIIGWDTFIGGKVSFFCHKL